MPDPPVAGPFLAALSSASRRFSTFQGYDLAAARELCDAIARYDKLSLVLADVGATPADDLQDRGLGTLALPRVEEAARLLGRRRIILWGGVRADNPRAIRYYEKNGFRTVGAFAETDGSLSLDMMLDLDPVSDPP